MNRSTRWWSAIGLGVVSVLALAAWAEEKEEKVTLDQVPAAVKATILKEAAGAQVTEIERATKNGNTVYEAEFLHEGKEVEIQVAPDGTLLGREVEAAADDEDDLTLDQLPEPARAALLKLAGGVTITEVGRELEHGTLVYEAEWTAGGVAREAAVLADGTVVETEETIPVNQVPATVQAAIVKHFGPGAKVVVEKKMILVYEVEGKVNGQDKELLVFPTGQVHDETGEDDDDREGDDD